MLRCVDREPVLLPHSGAAREANCFEENAMRPEIESGYTAHTRISLRQIIYSNGSTIVDHATIF